MTKIRNWAYFIFMLIFAALGFIEATVMQQTVTLFEYIKIPAMTKYILPVITCSAFIVWCLWILMRLGTSAEAEEDDDFEKAKEITTKILLESPTVCTACTLGAILLLDAMQEHLIGWEAARAIYSYSILWVTLVPCISFMLEFLQGINGFAGMDKEKNEYLKKAQTIDGLISTFLSLIAFVLLIVIGNMSVCYYMYIIYIIIIAYRLIRYYHVTTVIWTIASGRETNEIDEKEGIL